MFSIPIVRDPTSDSWADPGTGEILDHGAPKGLKVLSDPLKQPQSFMENERLAYEKVQERQDERRRFSS